MKEANLISVLNAYKELPPELFKSYLKYHSINIKNDELNDLGVMVTHLLSISKQIDLFDKYFIGYSIPQISKEFDLIRLDDETIVNIELKNQSTVEKIKKQMVQNKYYLSFLKKEMQIFTYIAEEKKIYTLDEDANVKEVTIRHLLGSLATQNVLKIKNIDNLFNPTNYLVSPFNSTQEFIKGKYFLTNHQEEIKKTILTQLGTAEYSILSIKGKAGTGKTLLTYDIAKEVYDKNEVLIIHCGILNNGQNILRDKYGWNIVPVKGIYNQDLSRYYLIIIDEVQRIYKDQLIHVITQVKKHSTNCILSCDGQQTLRKDEINNDISTLIDKEVTFRTFELTDKIRTNKEVASFILALFNKDKPKESYNYSSIEINYFNNYEIATDYLNQLYSENWKIINYTPSTRWTMPYVQYSVQEEFDNAHTVIGQEFDNVVAVVDEYFYYKKNKLSTRNYKFRPYYHPTKMLFQIVSRTRLKLNIIIIKNPEILSRCLEILK